MSKNRIIKVKDTKVTITTVNEQDYISLTDMVRNMDNGLVLIEKWLRNKNTIEFLAIWEELNNPDFNSPEFEGIKSEAGTNRFALSAKQWINKTNAIGVYAKAGRYGGTYAHKDIAFEFGSWLSPSFKLYLIKEYQRLKKSENNQYNLEWSVKRILAKANYFLHTDSVQKYIIPKLNLDKEKEWLGYAEEADLLNLAMFGFTAKHWKDANPTLAKKNLNVRDFASINELMVLSNLELINSRLIEAGIDKQKRYYELKKVSNHQLRALNKLDVMKSIKKVSEEALLFPPDQSPE